MDQASELATFKLAEKLSSTGHWSFDVAANRLFWSDQTYRIHGRSQSDLEPNMDAFLNFVVPSDAQRVSRSMQQAMASGRGFETSYRITRQDQSIRYVTLKVDSLCNDRGELVQLVGVMQDISQDFTPSITPAVQDTTMPGTASQAEKLEFQRLLMNTNTDLVFVKDEKFRIVEANAAFLAFYPESMRDSVMGTTTIEEYEPEQVELFLKEDKRAFIEGISEVVESVTFPDGSDRTLLTKKIRFENDRGERFILGVSRDITSIKQTENKLRELNEELEEFAYRTSHDLRSPLVSSARLLDITLKELERNNVDRAAGHIRMASESLHKLEALVTDLLKLTRIEHEELASASIDISSQISESLTKMAHMEGYNAIDFDVDCEPGLTVEQPKIHFALVVENLISNAIKYHNPAQPKPKVTIRVAQEDKKLTLVIADNGLGIPESQHEHLFKMFKRFHPRASFGSGLGLYMIKKSVDKMGGQVNYEPRKGEGTGSQFALTLPLKLPS